MRTVRLAALLVMPVLALAQTSPQQPIAPVRLLAFGQDGGVQERFRAARSADELRAIAATGSLAIDGAVDFAKELVVVLWFGDGRGGRPTISCLDDLTPDPRRLLRIAGAAGAPRVQDRWAAFTLPTAWEPWRPTAWFETDAPPLAGDTVWREVLPGRAPLVVAPLATVRGGLREPVLCFTDAIAFDAYVAASGEPVPFAVSDFALQVVLAVAEAGPSLYLLGGDIAPGQGRTVVRRWAPPADPAAERTFAWFVLPRRAGVLDFEEPVPGSPGQSRVVKTFAIDAPGTAARLQVLRRFECELEAQAATRCERATTAAEWQELKKRLGGAAAKLPDDWCDFEHHCVVAIAVAEGRVLPGLELAVTEEEGVDVLGVTQTGPSGKDPGRRSSCTVLVVPRRKGQLAVVFRRDTGQATGAEQTLRVFPGF